MEYSLPYSRDVSNLLYWHEQTALMAAEYQLDLF